MQIFPTPLGTTGNDEWMQQRGAEIILDAAMFLGSRVEFNSERQRYEIRGVNSYFQVNRPRGRGATPLGGFADLKDVALHSNAVPLRQMCFKYLNSAVRTDNC